MDRKYDAWPEEYARRLVPAEDAARLVQPGDAVCIPTGALVPTVTTAIFGRRAELRDIDIYCSAPINDPGWWTPGDQAFRMHIEVFSTPVSRAAMRSHHADFTSVAFSTRFKALDERAERIHGPDVALVAVGPPDHLGFCSFGLSIWNSLTFARRAKTVIAEVHSTFPRTFGEGRLHVTEVDAFVEAAPLPPRNPVPLAADYPAALAGFVSELIHDGDTIQVGTGGLTNGLPGFGAFDDKEDLGVHAELSVPGMTGLVRRGVITGARKSLHPRKYVSTQLEASGEGDIDFINENPMFELFDVGYVNDPRVIARNDNLVAINNALAVDFAGQITAESIGSEMWSGPGGQQDFAIGSLLSKGGRNITVLRSTAADDSVSRIMARLPEGAIVTVPRQYADYVVTEHGIARLHGKSDRERAQELIAVAHPDHRADLLRAFERG